MLKVLCEDIVLQDQGDIINLILALKKQAYFATKHPVDKGLCVLDASISASAPYRDNDDEIRAAFFCLAMHCDRFDPEFRLLFLALKALYQWNWIDSRESYSYVIGQILIKCASVWHQVLSADYATMEFIPRAILGMAACVSVQDTPLFMLASLNAMKAMKGSEWPTVGCLYKICIEREICCLSEFSLAIKDLWTTWGPGVDSVLAIVDSLFAMSFRIDGVPEFLDLLAFIFQYVGQCAHSVSLYIVSRLNKWLCKKSVEKCELRNVLGLILCIPSSQAICSFVKRFIQVLELERAIDCHTLFIRVLAQNDLGETACRYVEKLVELKSDAFFQIFPALIKEPGLCQDAHLCDFLNSQITPEPFKRAAVEALLMLFGDTDDISRLSYFEFDCLFDRLLSIARQSPANGPAIQLLAYVTLCQVRSGKRSAQAVFDAFSFNNSWIKMDANARGIPFRLCELWERIDQSFASTHKASFQGVRIITLSDYVLSLCDDSEQRILAFESELYDHFTHNTSEATFTIKLVEQVVLQAITEAGQPEWYPPFFVSVTLHLLRRYHQMITQRAAFLRQLKMVKSINYTNLANLLLLIDGADRYELLCHFMPSDRHVPGFIENLVLSFDAPQVYALFNFLLKRPLSGRVIDMFMDWLFSINHPSILDLAHPVYSLSGVDRYLLECGRSLFRLMMLPVSMRDSLPDALVLALIRCFDASCRHCHPSSIFRPPSVGYESSIISLKIDLSSERSRFPLLSESELAEEPQSIEDVFFMIGSLLRQRPQIPPTVSASVSEFFDRLKGQ